MRLRYSALLAGVFVLALLASWRFGGPVDNASYDAIFQSYSPLSWDPQSVILAIDEPTLLDAGGIVHIRRPLARALQLIDAARPAAVAVDLVLADAGDPAESRELSEAF